MSQSGVCVGGGTAADEVARLAVPAMLRAAWLLAAWSALVCEPGLRVRAGLACASWALVRLMPWEAYMYFSSCGISSCGLMCVSSHPAQAMAVWCDMVHSRAARSLSRVWELWLSSEYGVVCDKRGPHHRGGALERTEETLRGASAHG